MGLDYPWNLLVAGPARPREVQAMSEDKPFRVFVVHDFSVRQDYLRVFEYLESRANFFYVNVSNPEAKLPDAKPETAKEELRRQIALAEIVILPVESFAKNPVLMRYQIDLARSAKKPVLGIKSFGETVVMPKTVLELANDIVDWNDRAIVDGIRRLARGENTAHWETIEFKLD
jgi:hypothetical protein